MTEDTRVEGFAELDATLGELSKGIAKGAMRRALKKAAEPMAEIARSGVPVDKGDLRDSIGVGTKLSKRQAKLHRRETRDDKAFVEMFVGAGPLPSAHLQEFGTLDSAPQPFMRPAWDQDQNGMLERLKDELADEVERTAERARRRAARAG